jgi:hypothetical protein
MCNALVGVVKEAYTAGLSGRDALARKLVPPIQAAVSFSFAR